MRKSLSVEPGSSAIGPPRVFSFAALLHPPAPIASSLPAHGLFRKPVSTFRDHAPLALTAFHRYISAEIPTFPKGAGQNGPSVHLSHAGSDQDLSAQPESFGEHQPVVLSGRQDRRAPGQRLGQIDLAAHHGW